MTTRTTLPPRVRRPLRPGPVAWLVIGIGFGVMTWALLGVFRESERTASTSWFTWVIGAAILHDGLLLPVVFLAGAAFAALRRPALRSALRWAVGVGAIVTLVTLPVVTRVGARPDNDSLLPLDAARNLAVMWGVLLVGAVLVGLLVDWRRGHRSAPTPERSR